MIAIILLLRPSPSLENIYFLAFYSNKQVNIKKRFKVTKWIFLSFLSQCWFLLSFSCKLNNFFRILVFLVLMEESALDDGGSLNFTNCHTIFASSTTVCLIQNFHNVFFFKFYSLKILHLIIYFRNLPPSSSSSSCEDFFERFNFFSLN